jgi:hypothetical protein
VKVYQATNLKDLWDQLGVILKDHPTLVPKKGGGFNFRGDYYIHLYDLFFEVESSLCPRLYLEDLGYASSGAKTTNLLGKYLDIEWTNKWIDFIVECMEGSPDVAGDILLNTKPQGKRAMPGGCITSLIYRGAPKPMLTVISRAVEMPTKGAADMLLISAICELLCDRLDLADMKVQWYFSSAWTRTRTSFYYVIYKWPEKVVFANPLFQAYIDKGWQKYYLTDFEFSYSANQRAKKLFLNKQAGTLTKICGAHKVYETLEKYLKGGTNATNI